MGIRNMQGVSAHIEYIKKNPEVIEFVNCKFWKEEICYNNISTKYGERCYSKRGCMYSIPMPKDSKPKRTPKKTKEIPNQEASSIKVTHGTGLSYTTKNNVIKKYFSNNMEKEIRIENKTYKIQTSYNKVKDLLLLNLLYKNGNCTVNFKLYLKLKDVISIQGNEVIFNVKLNTIITKANTLNKRLGELIKENNSKDIIRKATLSNEKEVKNSVDSLIKFTSCIIIRELLKIYK